MMEFTEPDMLKGPRKSIRLKYQECLFLRALADAHPRPVSHEQMAAALYDKPHRRRPASWRRCIYMLAASLREAASAAGHPAPEHWVVTEIRGYRLDNNRRK